MGDAVLLAEYMGWSPKEGSGIFDPLRNLEGLAVQYYKMTADWDIDWNDLSERIEGFGAGKFAVLVVNYFGFVDPRIREISSAIKEHSGWVVEDNAHGFFTYQYMDETRADATFFSLHKMFPFERGGSLVVHNERLRALKYSGDDLEATDFNPWRYDVPGIARARRSNYARLEAILSADGVGEFLVPLKPPGLAMGVVPQSFPICILKGDRDRIYELMNESGYGVVSLYHTLIEPLRFSGHEVALALSKRVMNLPVHQDVDPDGYREMVSLLVDLCKATSPV